MRQLNILAMAGVGAVVLLGAGCGVLSGAHSGHDAAKVAPAASAGARSADQGAGSHIYNLIQAGITQAEKQDTKAASATFHQVLTLEPDNKYAWFNLGVIAQGQGDTAGALDDYNRAILTDAGFISALYNKALLIEQSDPGQAEKLYKQAIALNPHASTAYLHLGLLLQKQNPDQATADFNKAVSLDASLAQFVPGGESSTAPSAAPSMQSGG